MMLHWSPLSITLGDKNRSITPSSRQQNCISAAAYTGASRSVLKSSVQSNEKYFTQNFCTAAICCSSLGQAVRIANSVVLLYRFLCFSEWRTPRLEQH